MPVIVMQHVEDAAHLRHVRSVLVRAAHVGLAELARLDQRIAAHLDGVAIAGECGASLVLDALERRREGAVFVATVRAIEDRAVARLDDLLAAVEAIPAGRTSLVSAFGWVSAAHLQGTTKALLESASPWRREVGLAACAMHGVDPGSVLSNALNDADSSLRARALCVAGRLGRRDRTDACLVALADEDLRCAFEGARAAVLLGDRAESLDVLEALAVDPATERSAQLSALSVFLKVASPARTQSTLGAIQRGGGRGRTVVRAIATAGDPHYVPWLIAQMPDPKLARLAGEAFSLISGVALTAMGLGRKPADSIEPGPNDDSDDSNVDLDEDGDLPWPDPVKIETWWNTHGARFASRSRYFMGEAPQPAKCLQVLKTGFQRQRTAAAEYLTLLTPGTGLFNTGAPGWRQQRLLGR